MELRLKALSFIRTGKNLFLSGLPYCMTLSTFQLATAASRPSRDRSSNGFTNPASSSGGAAVHRSSGFFSMPATADAAWIHEQWETGTA